MSDQPAVMNEIQQRLIRDRATQEGEGMTRGRVDLCTISDVRYAEVNSPSGIG